MNHTPPTPDDHTDSEIAIIGLSGRFPASPDLTTFWHHLREGVECISHFSEQELAAAGVAPQLLRHPDYVKAFGNLEDVELFDAAFFGFSPKEAEATDPQHRLFLECAWAALENAGCDPERHAGPIGVFAGLSSNGYRIDYTPSIDPSQASLGNLRDFLPTRASYKLNLKGPSVNVQTACSSSLVAVHLACQSLLNGECDLALAGGVSVRALRKRGYLYQEGGISSPDGHCRAYDAAARGTVGGDGLGIVVLKPLEQALADGDRVRAVIKGSAINNDGAAKVGYTAPSVEGQAAVIAEAQAVAEVPAETVTYVEGHGTGTPLGDPVELDALIRAFRRGGARKTGICALGSVKTNIGHLDAAAGIAGLIKTVLALEHRELPPSLHFASANPAVDLSGTPFYVNDRLRSWPRGETPRRAGVSSFGIGGTNAHVVLEEAPEPEPSAPSRSEHLLAISAKTSKALEQATSNLAEKLRNGSVDKDPMPDLADVAYTLQVGRRAFHHRRVVVVKDPGDAVSALTACESRRVFTRHLRSAEPPVAFLFPGQGAQHPNMGLGLYHAEPTFRQEVDRCCRILEPHLDLDLRRLLYPVAAEERDAGRQLQQTLFTQPALFVVEYALAKLWMEWGVEPTAMIGHSIGEMVAACLAGVFSLETALRLAARRGRLIWQLPAGAMLSVSLPAEELRPLLGEALSLAAVNSSSRCVVSGPEEAVESLADQLGKNDVDRRRLVTSHAFHSWMMEPILETFAKEVGKVELRAPAIPFLSNVTGTWITPAEATDPEYWARHIRETVLFAKGLERLSEKDTVLLEVGPGRTLSTLARQDAPGAPERVVLSTLPHPNDPPTAASSWLTTLGRLWLAGVPVCWSGYHAHERRRKVELPTYPFERHRFFIDGSEDRLPGLPRELSALPRLVSSLKGFVDAPEEIGDSGANRFLNALMQGQAPGQGAFTVTFNWERGGEETPAMGFELSFRVEGARTPQAVISLTDGQEAASRRTKSRSLPLSELAAILVSAPPEAKSTSAFRAAALERAMAPQTADSAMGHRRPDLDTPYVPPRTDLEKGIAAIWHEILGIAQVGVEDSFFDLGGDSLLATRIATRLRREYGVELPLQRFFQTASVAETARAVQEALEQEPAPAVTAIAPGEEGRL